MTALPSPSAPADTNGGYAYSVEQCDVLDRTSLGQFRQKRREWLAWLKDDEHHAIATLVSSMAWNDVSFRALGRVAELDPNSALHNPLVAEAIIQGHFAIQILAARRLMDRTKGTISLARLLDDIRRYIALFTRENFVAHDGLPYDYHAAEHRVISKHAGKGPFWGAKSGPDAWVPSKRAHDTFDRLAGIDAAHRSRTDRIPNRVIDTLITWLAEEEATQLVDWSHTFLAHAAGAASRQHMDLAAARPTLDKITAALRQFIRITQALMAYILFESGHGMIVPVPQFNQFERLAAPLFTGRTQELFDFWHSTAKERDGYLEGTLDDLVKQGK